MLYYRELVKLNHLTQWGEFWSGTRHQPEHFLLSQEELEPLHSEDGRYTYDPTKLLITEAGEGSFGLFEEALYPNGPEFTTLLKRALDNFNTRIKEIPTGFAHFALNCYFTSTLNRDYATRTTTIKIKDTGAILEITFPVNYSPDASIHLRYTDKEGKSIAVNSHPITFLYFHNYIEKDPLFGTFIKMWSDSMYSFLRYKHISNSEEILFSGLYKALHLMAWEYEFIWDHDLSMTALPEVLVHHLTNPSYIHELMSKMKGAYYGSYWLTLLLTKEESKPFYKIINKGRLHNTHPNVVRELITNAFYQLSLGRDVLNHSDWAEDSDNDNEELNTALKELFYAYRGDPFYLWLLECWKRPDVVEYNLIDESTNLHYTLALNSFTELDHLSVYNSGGHFAVMQGTTPYGLHTGVVQGIMMGMLEERVDNEEKRLGYYRLNELISQYSPLIPDQLKGYTEEDKLLRILYPIYYLETQGDTLGYHVSILEGEQ